MMNILDLAEVIRANIIVEHLSGTDVWIANFKNAEIRDHYYERDNHIQDRELPKIHEKTPEEALTRLVKIIEGKVLVFIDKEKETRKEFKVPEKMARFLPSGTGRKG